MARFLEANPAVSRVYYPELASDPELPPGAAAPAARRWRPPRLRAAGWATGRRGLGGPAAADPADASLGHVATTVSHPASTSHRGLSPDERRRAGIEAGLVGSSVGLEPIDDLTADLKRALTG